MRNSFHILLLPGDGIGPEVVEAAQTVMDVAAEHFGVELTYEERKIGGAALRDEGEPISEETLERARASDALLLGAVGHPDFDRGAVRPEGGLLRLRKELGAFANLRPVAAIPDRKSTRLNYSHANISYAVFCLKKKKKLQDYSSRQVRSTRLC